jgi:hypothetical protein
MRGGPFLEGTEGVWPQTLLQLLPRNYGAGLLQQNRQHLERLAGQFQSQSSLAQFLCLKVHFKRGKANYLAGADLVWHRWVASSGKVTEARMRNEDV